MVIVTGPFDEGYDKVVLFYILVKADFLKPESGVALSSDPLTFPLPHERNLAML